MSATSKDVRELLTAIGVGHFNATAIVPFMFISPATTDPKAAQTLIIVGALQRTLFAMGATDVPLSGRLDAATAQALARVAGPDWERMTWAANVAAVVAAKEAGMSLRAPPASQMGVGAGAGVPVAIGGPLDFLPDVPGGLVTYAVGAYLLYRHFTKGSRA